jgi:SAM-dependent methyltransferase/DNA-binding transcriptional ArsR family regulator
MDERTHPNRQQILDLMAGFQPACVIGAAAELNLFTALGDRSLTVEELSERLGLDLRAARITLDAVTALGLLEKSDKADERYTVPAELRPMLTDGSPESILPMVRHRMTCLRGWMQLAWVTKAGIPGPRVSSIRGPAADREAFVAAMHTVSGPMADRLVARFGPPTFGRLLDVGGASGTWTLALLRAMPGATATIFDLPDAIEQARERLAGTEFEDRVTLVAGDFYTDELPGGADLAWVSAIIHQHDRRHNRELFGKVFRALVPGGRIGIRDIIMEPSRTQPLDGALFAVNMLVATDTGGTFTFEELSEDLQAAGFVEPELRVKDEAMNSVVMARRK